MSGTPLFLFGLAVTVVVAAALLLRAYAAILDHSAHQHDRPSAPHDVRRTPFHHT